MPKRFDREEEPNDYMEAPCRCDCGNWFDQQDGHSSQRKQNRIICGECADTEQEEIDREEQIQEWKDQLADAEYTIKEATRELTKLGALVPVKSEDDPYEELVTMIARSSWDRNEIIAEAKKQFIVTKR